MRESLANAVRTPPPAPALLLWSSIAEHAPLPMAAIEGSRQIVRNVNAAFCRLLDRPAEALLNQPLSELFPAHEDLLAVLARVEATGRAVCHSKPARATHQVAAWSYAAWPIMTDGQTQGVMLQVTESQTAPVAIEVSEALLLASLRQHELVEAAAADNESLRGAIQEVEAREAGIRKRAAEFEALFADIPMGVFVVDQAMRIRQVNAAALPWFSDIDGLVGRDLAEVMQLIWMPDVAADLVLRVEQTMATGEPYIAPEFVHDRRDRHVTEYYALQLHEIQLPEQSHGVVCYFRDIAIEVNAREEMQQAGVRKDEFLAMLAHELRNPLAPIGYMIEVLKRADGDAALSAPAIATMERQLVQMTRIIDDLLDVSRISRGKLELRREVFELAPALQEIADAFRYTLGLVQQGLVLSLPLQAVYVHGDRARLLQVVGNLLHNASKFTGTGGQISLAAALEGDTVLITVKDSGIGISAEMLPKIFGMFVQGDRQAEQGPGGLGIGLTLVRRLVEMHGGSVEAFSEGPGKGTQIIARLPTSAPAAVAPPPVPAPVPSAGRRILIVDDNEDTAMALSQLLALTGNETHLAFNGLEAIEAAKRLAPDVILMDIGMPKMDGYDAARHIRELPGGADIVMLALTGLGQATAKHKATAAGFDGHLVKPVDFEVLSQQIDTAMRERKAGDPGGA